MRDSNTCPKCGSKNIKFNDGRFDKNSNYYDFAVNYVLIHSYVCLNCGYIENWLNQDEIDGIRYCVKTSRS